ncbi:DUF4194 domain-containing protein [Ferrovibrio sp. MS7]|uniref:DUF4194 domain-containing protein n=1 Tax=Ferrovibrio plantarum TaxID=3119164 RepID=UPI0031347E3E
MNEDIQTLADKIDRTGAGADMAFIMQSLLDRQFFIQGDRFTDKLYAMAREKWRDVEAILGMMGYQGIMRTDIGVIGFRMRPLVHPRTGEVVQQPRERRLDVRTTLLLLTLRHLYHARRSMGDTTGDDDATGIDDVIVTSDEIETAITDTSPQRSYPNTKQLRDVLKDLEYHGLVHVDAEAEEPFLVKIRPTITIVLSQEKIGLLKRFTDEMAQQRKIETNNQ